MMAHLDPIWIGWRADYFKFPLKLAPAKTWFLPVSTFVRSNRNVKSPLLSVWMCFGSIALMPAIASAAPKAQTVEISDKLHTPSIGSAERAEIMDGLRDFYKTHPDPHSGPWRGKITFKVGYLKVHNGWAWIYAEPRSTDPKDSFGENDGYLLHLKDGRWSVMDMPPMDDNLDGSRPPTAKDLQRLQKKYPTLPVDIIPKG